MALLSCVQESAPARPVYELAEMSPDTPAASEDQVSGVLCEMFSYLLCSRGKN